MLRIIDNFGVRKGIKMLLQDVLRMLPVMDNSEVGKAERMLLQDDLRTLCITENSEVGEMEPQLLLCVALMLHDIGMRTVLRFLQHASERRALLII